MNRCLYIFIDESGNLDFSPRATKYFILTGFATFDPVVGREKFIDLKYRLLAKGFDQEEFHATEDRQVVRDEVYKNLALLRDSFEIHSVVAQKNRANPALYREVYQKGSQTIVRNTGVLFYQKVCEVLLKYIFIGKQGKVDTIVIVLGALFTGDKKKAALKTLKQYLKENFPGIPFEIYCHRSLSDINCQLADYCSWAIGIKRERGEGRPYEIIRPMIKNEFEIFRNGTNQYYTYSP